MKKGIGLGLLVFSLTLFMAFPVGANIVNFGVDIRDNGSTAQVGFYNGQVAKGGNDGVTLRSSGSGGPTSVSFNILTPGLTGSTINGFELFVDATNVDTTDNFDVQLFNNGQGLLIVINDVPSTGEASTYVPVEAGPLGTHVLSPYEGDVDNSFFYKVPAGVFGDEILAGALNVQILRNSGGGEARFDGVNLQVDYTPARVPEPMSLLLLGLGLVGIGAVRRKK
jgi:hypothetical protein